MKFNCFLILVFGLILPFMVIAQDDAPEQRILDIRKHYQEVNNNPDIYKKQQLTPEIVIYTRYEKPHKIVVTNTTENEVIEYYHQGDIAALNFIFSVKDGAQNRYYFSNDIGFPMDKPMLCRWIDENKKHYRYKDKDFVEKGVAMSAQAHEVYFEVLMRLEWGNEKYDKVRSRMDEIDAYIASLKDNVSELRMPGGFGFAPPKPYDGPDYDPDTGEPLFDAEYKDEYYLINSDNQIVMKVTEGGIDVGCTVANAYEFMKCYKDLRMVYDLEFNFSKIAGRIIEEFKINSWDEGDATVKYYFGTDDMPVLKKTQYRWDDTSFDEKWEILK